MDGGRCVQRSDNFRNLYILFYNNDPNSRLQRGLKILSMGHLVANIRDKFVANSMRRTINVLDIFVYYFQRVLEKLSIPFSFSQYRPLSRTVRKYPKFQIQTFPPRIRTIACTLLLKNSNPFIRLSCRKNIIYKITWDKN